MDNWNPIWTNQSLKRGKTLSPKIFKNVMMANQSCPSHSNPISHIISPNSFLSLSTSLSSLSSPYWWWAFQSFWPPCHRWSTTRTRRWGRKATIDQAVEVSAPDDGWWAPRNPQEVTPLPLFLAVFRAVRPPFTVGPPVLERVLHPLQNFAPCDGQIISVKKLVTIHTVSSTAFFSELGKFGEVRPPKV